MIPDSLAQPQLVELASELLTTVIADLNRRRIDAEGRGDRRAAEEASSTIESLYALRGQLGSMERDDLTAVVSRYAGAARAVVEHARYSQLTVGAMAEDETRPAVRTRSLVDRLTTYARDVLLLAPRLAVVGTIAPVGVRSSDLDPERRWKLLPTSGDAEGVEVYLALNDNALLVDVVMTEQTELSIVVAVRDEAGYVSFARGQLVSGFGSVSIPWFGSKPLDIAIASA